MTINVISKSTVKIFARLIGLAFLFWALYYFVDFKAFKGHLLALNLWVLTLVLVMATVDRFSMAYKWMHLSRAISVELPFNVYLALYYVASFLNYCLPSTLGGELIVR